MHQNIKKSNRIVWLDSLKGLAIISVVLGHAFLAVQQINLFPEKQNMVTIIKEYIYTWHMPLFFVLSGMAFRISCLKDDSPDFSKIRKNALNLFIIYLIFATALPVLKIIFSQFVNNKVYIKDLIKVILLPDTLMWYLWVLIIYYFLFPLLFNKKHKSIIFTVLLCISFIATYLYKSEILTQLSIRNLFICAVFFYIGMQFRELISVTDNKVIVAVSGCFIMIYILYVSIY
ncbi:MAG: acyltransferase, partial [Ruminococcus sp.]|nr:acyltransferase [Ruminococcus sp.]